MTNVDKLQLGPILDIIESPPFGIDIDSVAEKVKKFCISFAYHNTTIKLKLYKLISTAIP